MAIRPNHDVLVFERHSINAVGCAEKKRTLELWTVEVLDVDRVEEASSNFRLK